MSSSPTSSQTLQTSGIVPTSSMILQQERFGRSPRPGQCELKCTTYTTRDSKLIIARSPSEYGRSDAGDVPDVRGGDVRRSRRYAEVGLHTNIFDVDLTDSPWCHFAMHSDKLMYCRNTQATNMQRTRWFSTHQTEAPPTSKTTL